MVPDSNPGPANGNDVDINVHSKFCKCNLVLNCGLARVVIYDLSSILSGHYHNNILDEAARPDHFSKLFSNVLPFLMSLKEWKSILTTYSKTSWEHSSTSFYLFIAREQVDEEGYKEIIQLVEECYQEVFEYTRKTLRREVNNCTDPTITRGTDAERTVNNLSKRPLTPEEMNVLALGLNFSMTQRSLPVIDVITAIEGVATQLPQQEAEEIRVQTKRCIERSKAPQQNMRRDLRAALKNLRHDYSISDPTCR